MLSFPHGERDDQVDSMTLFLRWAQQFRAAEAQRTPVVRPKSPN
jgi:hypothetical protein